MSQRAARHRRDRRGMVSYLGYSVKELFYTLQGEGARAGRPAVFLRFSGCNLWTGRESDRPTAVCRFCDTEFVGTPGPGGGRFDSAEQLADAALERWPGGGAPYVVCTGGEPLLQLDAPLIQSLHQRGFEVAIETNGTLDVPDGVDWVCVSPKAGAELRVREGDELKLVFPQVGAAPERFEALAFGALYLQPMYTEHSDHTAATVAYCLAHPKWRLSLQTHKWLGIP